MMERKHAARIALAACGVVWALASVARACPTSVVDTLEITDMDKYVTRHENVTVEVTATLNGNPAPGIMITFTSSQLAFEGEPPHTAETDAQGKAAIEADVCGTPSGEVDGANVHTSATDPVMGEVSDDEPFTVVGVEVDALDPSCVARNWELQLGSTLVPASVTMSGGTYSWAENTGPGEVTFGSPASDSTTVRADTAGEYTVNVTYTNGGVDTDASATINVFEVTIDEPATEFMGVDEMIALDCDVTPGAAAGGTYKWSADTDGGTADTDMVTFSPDDETEGPSFFGHVPDEYKLRVEYTKAETTDTDTYETIYVFEADLDIADVADADELNPGGFLAYNDDDDDNDGSVRPCRNPSGIPGRPDVAGGLEGRSRSSRG